MGNVAVNSGFSILLGDLTDGLTGFLVSTIVITIFGEIIPQAICARYGLYVGGYVAPAVVLLEWMLFPLVKPLAMLLNLALGEDLGTVYDRKQMKALIQFHGDDVHLLTKEEGRILQGGLDFALRRVDAVMTPMHKVFGLEVESVFDYATASSLLRSGYTRIPVLDRSRPQSVCGLLHAKDLILMDANGTLPMRTIVKLFGRNVYAVDADATLLSLLSDFKKGHSHLAVVRRAVEAEGCDPYYEHVGIITLEDILEEILQDEIQDEFDFGRSALEGTAPLSPSASSSSSSSSSSSGVLESDGALSVHSSCLPKAQGYGRLSATTYSIRNHLAFR
eukprot:GHVT01051251.1.p1 GENE.GHVT01051251.1~~GHVT01051251.1.p1  ORF type:complete len:334 (+),score=61.51 GHVT01051251.1:327-1328(+)